jgi:hypothetical protein
MISEAIFYSSDRISMRPHRRSIAKKLGKPGRRKTGHEQ